VATAHDDTAGRWASKGGVSVVSGPDAGACRSIPYTIARLSQFN
jgi:hypothetical protein